MNGYNNPETVIRKKRREKLKRIKRNRIIKMMLSFCLVFILAMMSGSIISYAKSSKQESPSYKYYTSVTIQEGDTLTTIAKENISPEFTSVSAYINEVRQMNHLDSEKIYSGQSLIIPYYSLEFK